MSLIGNPGFAPNQKKYIDNLANNENILHEVFTISLPDVVAQNKSFFVFRAPYNGTILSASLIINSPFITSALIAKLQKTPGALEGAPAVMTDITNGLMNIPFVPSVLGYYSECTPSGNNTFEEGEYIAVHFSGGEIEEDQPTGACVTIVVEKSSE